MVGCSISRDLELVEGTVQAHATDLWWVRLHDGHVLGHKSYGQDAVANVVASSDLTYFAENYVAAPHPPGAPDVTTLRRVTDGQAVGTRGDLVEAFSADHTEMVTDAFNYGTVGVFTVGGEQLWMPEQPSDRACPSPFGANFATIVPAAGDAGSDKLELVTRGRSVDIALLPANSLMAWCSRSQ
ncbi:MAG TPA: hypothetical protein VF070_29525 [Streptosporangiaceae bacterium]